ncbi:hypothetical protein VTK56DRAFT_3432 [Thermocarpiscus australiensis]
MLSRAVSLRSSNRSSKRSSQGTTGSSASGSHAAPSSPTRTNTTASSVPHRHRFSFASLRGSIQPELSKRLYRLIKSENNLIAAHRLAARERVSIARQLSEWGEQTGDEAVSDVSDKVGVLLSELGEHEDAHAAALDESRGVLKAIRDTEKSVQPSRDGKRKIAAEIARLKGREPQSARLVTMEQELVRAEAENLVAEAQLGNVTRQKLKEAYTAEFLAVIERADKQIILARHGLRLLQLLDDSPIVPGDVRPPYAHAAQARQVLNDAEDDLRDWRLDRVLGDDVKSVVVGGASPASPQARAREGKQKEPERRASVGETEGGGGSGSSRVGDPVASSELGG